ncbi:hypothetical protein ONS95_005577 [Cadophora gregata]|uniref:uncharacterized protein n=1 Tax=Cadophora gregata TaxID=51156 RepID=UPI0026DBDB13|nr:uncharacterized protein ONS95_005577 [Cadophora gregata]KAK0103560.1 hypothetical protein ONS95_005577 [Cadophora gregata]
MIRLPATTIVLGRSDLLDYEKRPRIRGRDREWVSETDKLNVRLARFTVRSQPDSIDPSQEGTVQSNFQEYQELHKQSHGHRPWLPVLDTPPAVESPEFTDCYEPGILSQGSDLPHEDVLAPSLPDEEQSFVSTGIEQSPENVTSETTRPGSPSKHDFYYGGFIEIDSRNSADYTSLSPNDASPSQQLQLPRSIRLRTRLHLPRSPLYLSQNASSSPDRRPTSGLTPRVASRVATQNTPGMIFAQPPRRPRTNTQTSIRTFRHQTNSFSFDSSERSSAAYEQERAISSSTDGRAQDAGSINLREDLRGSSLQSSRAGSADPYSISETTGEDDSAIIRVDREDADANQDVRISSLELHLPPPFSTVPRNVSRANSLPYSSSRSLIASHPSTSPISFTMTPLQRVVESRHSSRRSSPASAEYDALEASPPASSRFNPVAFVNRAISIYRVRSPFSRRDTPQAVAQSASPTPRQDQSRRNSDSVEPITPSRGSYQVYNDATSPELQPQTPAHLPEARHQSRYHPSYTAPVTRAAARRAQNIDNADGEGLQQSLPRQRQVPLYTPLRGGRPASPIGLVQGGFQGLYGGRENGDEEQSWVEGVRFNNAETRLWGTRDAQNEGGSLTRTPEPDEWRVGRRS